MVLPMLLLMVCAAVFGLPTATTRFEIGLFDASRQTAESLIKTNVPIMSCDLKVFQK
jgi:hypothetical protein